jgi:surface polysaccharide O-acyltransferase-like enzyme
MEKKNRYHYAIDGMRIIAILAVVGIHTTTKTIEASAFAVQNYPVTFFFNQFLRFAVPLFFMISGFVLEINYSYHQNYFTYLQKRFSRIFLPYFFWSCMYYFSFSQHTINGFPKTLLLGTASYQLYFIPTLLIFYIFFPFIHKYYRFFANKWVLLVLGVIQIIILLQEYYIRPYPLAYPINIALLNYYIFILGIVVSHHYKTWIEYIRTWKVIFLFLFCSLGLIVVFEAKLLYAKTHNYWYFYTQWRPSVLLYSLVVAGLSYILFDKKHKYQSVIHTFSKLSFFVFFIHIFILEQFWSLIGRTVFLATRTFPFQESWYGLFFFFSVAGVSYAMAYLAHKISLLSKITG